MQAFAARLGILLGSGDFEILEKHGGSKLISSEFKQVRQGPLFAIGDSIGAINPFLAEGIRQGLYTARFAVDAIRLGRASDYEKRWKRFKGLRWPVAERWARFCYERPNPRFIRAIPRIAEKMTCEELAQLVFDYRFELIFKRAPWTSARAIWSGAALSFNGWPSARVDRHP